MSPRRPDTSPQVGLNTPGPGTYDSSKFNMTLRSASNVKIGTSQREGIHTGSKNMPGPNHYTLRASSFTQRSDPRTVFGSGQRPPLAYLNSNPGPGNYAIPQRGVEGKKYTISGRYKQDAPNSNPSP